MLPAPVSPGVLVIDDDPFLLDLLVKVLGRRGFRVWGRPSGKEGVAQYLECPDEIAVVLLDVCMPGLDGPATLQQLREIDPEVRICFMSGYTGDYTLRDLRELGIEGFYAKPFDVLRLADDLWVIASACELTPARAFAV